MCSKSNLVDPSLFSVNVEFEPPPFIDNTSVFGACCFFFAENDRRFTVIDGINEITNF